MIGKNVIEFQVDLHDLDYHLRKMKDTFRYQVYDNKVRIL